ncbi:hypothetical protein NMY22_g18042 [Coprinellus aureogranulatus]|nr:hypothetical protein NMY22_g18042 [Coprinellus aureogranulatus]
MFPTPVGGLVLPSEFAACIIFCVLYGLLLPLVAYRIFNRRTRTFLLAGTISFSIERIVVFTLRALATQREGSQLSSSILKYQQTTFGLGFIGISNDIVNLLRCAIVNPTYGYERWDESPASTSKDTLFRTPEPGEEDHPIQRKNMRSIAGCVSLSFLASQIPGIVAATMFHVHNFENAEKATKVARLRTTARRRTLSYLVSSYIATELIDIDFVVGKGQVHGGRLRDAYGFDWRIGKIIGAQAIGLWNRPMKVQALKKQHLLEGSQQAHAGEWLDVLEEARGHLQMS